MHKKDKTNRLLNLKMDREGNVSEEVDAEDMIDMWLDNTMLEALYPGIKMALVTVPSDLEVYEQASVISGLSDMHWNGVTYRLVGASGSAKNGKFYAASIDYAPALQRRFQNWPEAAITYFGILSSDCREVVRYERARVLVVPDNVLGTNDCRAFMTETMWSKFTFAKGGFLQFRAAWGDKPAGNQQPTLTPQAKGSFKMMTDETGEFLRADFVIPESSIKPGIKYTPWDIENYGNRWFEGEVVVGIREEARPLTFGGSYTLTQNAPWDVIEKELIPLALDAIKKLAEDWNRGEHTSVLSKLGTNPESGFFQMHEAMLMADGAGGLIQHPYIQNQLKKLFAQWAFKVCTSAGMEMPGFALSDDGYLVLHEGKLYCGSDWIPLDICLTSLTSMRSLAVRYPIRMREDFLPMINNGPEQAVELLIERQGISRELAERITREQLFCTCTYTLHAETAKRFGGDYDFDQICVIDEAKYPMFVESRFQYELNKESHYNGKKTKHERLRSDWYALEAIAMNAMGNKVGQITNIMSSCLAVGDMESFYELVPQLQNEIDSLKHNIRADMKLVHAIGKKVGKPKWLEIDAKALRSVDQLPMEFQVAPTDVIGRMYLILRKEVADLFGKPKHISAFRGLIVGGRPSKDMAEECAFMNRVYGAGHALLRGLVESAQKKHQAAQIATRAAREAGFDEEIDKCKRAERKASNRLHEVQKLSEKKAKSLTKIIALWGASKPAGTRRHWVQAMNEIVCKGNGTGAVLFHAFPQDVVQAIASRTQGMQTLVEANVATNLSVVVESGTVVMYANSERLPMFQLERKTGRLVSLRQETRKIAA